jgi:hypothetical protein
MKVKLTISGKKKNLNIFLATLVDVAKDFGIQVEFKENG